jgi:hypothetical protein
LRREENLGKIDMVSLQNGLESFEGKNRTPPALTSDPQNYLASQEMLGLVLGA